MRPRSLLAVLLDLPRKKRVSARSSRMPNICDESEQNLHLGHLLTQTTLQTPILPLLLSNPILRQTRLYCLVQFPCPGQPSPSRPMNLHVRFIQTHIALLYSYSCPDAAPLPNPLPSDTSSKPEPLTSLLSALRLTGSLIPRPLAVHSPSPDVRLSVSARSRLHMLLSQGTKAHTAAVFVLGVLIGLVVGSRPFCSFAV